MTRRKEYIQQVDGGTNELHEDGDEERTSEDTWAESELMNLHHMTKHGEK